MLRLLQLVVLILVSTPLPAQIRLTDAQGVAMERHEPARRIVTLSASATELLYAAGAGDYLLATVTESRFPSASSLPRIGTAAAPDMKRLAQLRPDLVVASAEASGTAVIARLREQGLPVFVVSVTRPGDVADAVEQLGWLARTEAIAGLTAVSLREDIRRLRKRWPPLAGRPGAILLDPQAGLAAAGGHVLYTMVELCGVSNIFAGRQAPTLVAAPEQFAAAHWLLVAAATDPGWRQSPGWRDLPAIKNRQVFRIEDLAGLSGPRMPSLMEGICPAVRGEPDQ